MYMIICEVYLLIVIVHCNKYLNQLFAINKFFFIDKDNNKKKKKNVHENVKEIS